eukprot:scaffold131571_cov28-Tisochrysis_lutea.AAC.4
MASTVVCGNARHTPGRNAKAPPTAVARPAPIEIPMAAGRVGEFQPRERAEEESVEDMLVRSLALPLSLSLPLSLPLSLSVLLCPFPPRSLASSLLLSLSPLPPSLSRVMKVGEAETAQGGRRALSPRGRGKPLSS